MPRERLERQQVRNTVEAALAAQPVLDMHTHTYPAGFGTPVINATRNTDSMGLMLWGLDELVTYHYLIAEVYRVVTPDRLPYEQFWAMSRSEKADHISAGLTSPPSSSVTRWMTCENSIWSRRGSSSLCSVRMMYATLPLPDCEFTRMTAS